MPGKKAALSEQEVLGRLAALPGWELRDGAIRRTYQTDGWRGSVLVANAIAFICEAAAHHADLPATWPRVGVALSTYAIAFICEAADHHADLTVTWPRVGVALSTHSAGGITAKDFEVATLIERQVMWKPPAGRNLTGPAKPFVRD